MGSVLDIPKDFGVRNRLFRPLHREERPLSRERNHIRWLPTFRAELFGVEHVERRVKGDFNGKVDYTGNSGRTCFSNHRKEVVDTELAGVDIVPRLLNSCFGNPGW